MKTGRTKKKGKNKNVSTPFYPTEEIPLSSEGAVSVEVPVLAPQPSFMEQAAKVVDEHLSDEDFSPEQFAAEMAVSRALLFRKLKSASGQTVKEFINERRMILAVKLLTTTNRTMDDIAAACGYGNTSTFRRLFSKRFNVTPSQYREKK